MPGTIGNQNARKLTTDELKLEAYRQYCDHLAAGNSRKSWYFEHPTLTLTYETMEKEIRENPVVLDAHKKKVAEVKGFATWERLVQETAKGANKDTNVAAMQMLMRNRYKWDRYDQVFDDDTSSTQQSFESLMLQLAHKQKEAVTDRVS